MVYWGSKYMREYIRDARVEVSAMLGGLCGTINLHHPDDINPPIYTEAPSGRGRIKDRRSPFQKIGVKPRSRLMINGLQLVNVRFSKQPESHDPDSVASATKADLAARIAYQERRALELLKGGLLTPPWLAFMRKRGLSSLLQP